MRDGVLGNTPKAELQTYGPRIQIVGARAREGRGRRREGGVRRLGRRAGEPTRRAAQRHRRRDHSDHGRHGENPTATSTVRVHYHGTLRDGTVFDSSVQRGEPISFPLNGVIPCWTEGVLKIKVGGKAKLVCPSDTAYGDQGSGSIPGGAALAFEVELLAIEVARSGCATEAPP